MLYEIELDTLSDYLNRIIMAKVKDQTIVDRFGDYSDYDLTDRYSLMSIAIDEYQAIQAEEAFDYESMSVLFEDSRYCNE